MPDLFRIHVFIAIDVTKTGCPTSAASEYQQKLLEIRANANAHHMARELAKHRNIVRASSPSAQAVRAYCAVKICLRSPKCGETTEPSATHGRSRSDRGSEADLLNRHAGLSGIHVLVTSIAMKTWMAGTSPAMTECPSLPAHPAAELLHPLSCSPRRVDVALAVDAMLCSAVNCPAWRRAPKCASGCREHGRQCGSRRHAVIM